MQSQEKQFHRTVKLCPGTVKILSERDSSAEKTEVGLRLYERAQESLQRKKEKALEHNKLRLERMNPQITPKGKKS